MLEPWEEDRFGLNDDFPGAPMLHMGQIGGSGLNAEGMGTTGSLGVNFAAPLTRGGFAGEIFDPSPMPTGNWKNAPTPVMLGTSDYTASDVGKYTIFNLAVAGVLVYCVSKYLSQPDSPARQKMLAEDAELRSERSGNPRLRRFNRRWVRRR